MRGSDSRRNEGRNADACWLGIVLMMGAAAVGCGHPISWTHGHPDAGLVASSSAAGANRWSRPRWLPGPRELDAANRQATRQGQQLPQDDPLSLRYMPQRVGPEVHVYAARLFEHQGKWDKAIQRYQEALRVDANYEPALTGLARLYDRRGQFPEANRWYEQAVRSHPQSAAARNDWAMCLARQGRLPEAIALWHESARIQPAEVLYRNNLARALIQTGQLDEAYQQLAAVLPPAAAHYNIAYMLYEMGRHDMAVVALRKSLDLDPAFGRAQKLLATLQPAGQPPPVPPGTDTPRVAQNSPQGFPPPAPPNALPTTPPLGFAESAWPIAPQGPTPPSRYSSPAPSPSRLTQP